MDGEILIVNRTRIWNVDSGSVGARAFSFPIRANTIRSISVISNVVYFSEYQLGFLKRSQAKTCHIQLKNVISMQLGYGSVVNGFQKFFLFVTSNRSLRLIHFQFNFCSSNHEILWVNVPEWKRISYFLMISNWNVLVWPDPIQIVYPLKPKFPWVVK